MSKEIRIITYHRAVNNGAVLQSLGLVDHLSKLLPEYRIKILDYRHPKMEVMEFLKILKIYPKKPLFGLQRLLIFRRFQNKLPIDRMPNIFGFWKIVQYLNKLSLKAIFVGSDSIWKFSDSYFLPKIPNIFWLSPKLKSIKISYAASAYQYQENLLPKYRPILSKSVNSFNAVSVRDSETKNLLRKIDCRKEISQIPDPAFFYRIKKTVARDKLIKFGLKPDRPLFALITGYCDYQIKEIINYFRSQNYQIIALSIFNPLADVNLGDELNPEEWAEVFRYFDFCLTDRFHGSVFCLKNKTPFIAIESKNGKIKKSKKYQLLHDFNLQDECYLNLFEKNYSQKLFQKKFANIKKNWQKLIVGKIDSGLKKMERISRRFDKKITKLIK